MKLLLRIRFLGTAYAGYQVQKNANTVQAELNRATEALLGFPCDIVGCSRTDSGVHANEFCCTVTKKGSGSLDISLPADRFPRALSCLLPEDIGVTSAEWVREEFHPRYDVRYKEYVYRIHAAYERDPFLVGRALTYKHPIDDEAFTRMERAACDFCGEHDFSAFMAAGSKVQSTVRCVEYARLERDGALITFSVAANGFLYNMVRIMVGTLLDVAEGKIDADAIPTILASHDRSLAGFTAPPCGLYLNRVVY
ncbi:MAG: tRNA pseudouridine(38-40) synthase TruA [Clostridia bacterium]|nr:tRNA pseudouridine(38-40) synthase TruA [Clostridia bacterium]